MTKESTPTQKFIDIESVKQDTLVLRHGGLRKILMVSGLNFDLQSEEEQNTIIYSFQSFLNGLNFSVQVFIHSRKLNINKYLAQLVIRQKNEPLDLLKDIIGDYRNFIESFVGQNAIMEKGFFVVIPFDPVEAIASSKLFLKKLTGWVRKKPVSAEESAAIIQKNFGESLGKLNRRVDSVISGLAQIGLRAITINEKEIVELFYNLYNPETVERRL